MYVYGCARNLVHHKWYCNGVQKGGSLSVFHWKLGQNTKKLAWNSEEIPLCSGGCGLSNIWELFRFSRGLATWHSVLLLLIVWGAFRPLGAGGFLPLIEGMWPTKPRSLPGAIYESSGDDSQKYAYFQTNKPHMLSTSYVFRVPC